MGGIGVSVSRGFYNTNDVIQSQSPKVYTRQRCIPIVHLQFGRLLRKPFPLTMSFLSKSLLRSSSRLHPSHPFPRSFHLTAPRAALSESDHDRRTAGFLFPPYPNSPAKKVHEAADFSYLGYIDDSEERNAEIEHHKNDQLNKQKEGKGHWKRELSSNSEAAVGSAKVRIKRR